MQTQDAHTLQPAQSPPGNITVRPRPVAAKPVLTAIAPIKFILDNQPDVDLRAEINKLGITIRPSQNGRGTCSVFAMTFLLEYMHVKHFGMKPADLSEEFLNYASNRATGQLVDGGFFDEIDLGYQKFGDVSEAVAPYSTSFNPNLTYSTIIQLLASTLKPRLTAHFIKVWNVSTGLTQGQLADLLLSLKQGRPVAGGLRWPKDGKMKTESFIGVTTMIAPAPADVFDGHSIAFVGYKVSNKFTGGGYLVFRNHWGTGFMDKGYGYMTFDYALKYTNDLVEYLLP